jgi:acetylglutamate kinase
MSSIPPESSPRAYAMAALTLATAVAARLKAKGILLDSEIRETMDIGMALLQKMAPQNIEANEVRQILEGIYSVFIAPTPPPPPR